jgi:hypothetical protein
MELQWKRTTVNTEDSKSKHEICATSFIDGFCVAQSITTTFLSKPGEIAYKSRLCVQKLKHRRRSQNSLSEKFRAFET